MNKQFLIFCAIIFALSSCRPRLNFNCAYYYSDFKENKDVEFLFSPDSAFVIRDLHGNKRFLQRGKWRYDKKAGNNVILSDDTPPKEWVCFHGDTLVGYEGSLSWEKSFFEPIINDTVVLVGDKIRFRELDFVKGNVGEVGNISISNYIIFLQELTDSIYGMSTKDTCALQQFLGKEY